MTGAGLSAAGNAANRQVDGPPPYTPTPDVVDVGEEGDDSDGGDGDRFKGQTGATVTVSDGKVTIDRTSRRMRAIGCEDRAPRTIPFEAITGVHFIAPTVARSGWFQVLHGGANPREPTVTTWSKTPDTVMFTRGQQRRFSELRDMLDNVAAANAQRGVDPTTVSYADRPHSFPVDEAPLNTDVPDKVRRYLDKHGGLLAGEEVRAVLGMSPQVLIATDRRLLVVKVGWLAASTGGGRTTAFNWADITTIQVQLGITMGSLSVQSPGYGGTQTGDYWSTRNQQDPLQLPNVIPWSKALDRLHAHDLTWVRTQIDAVRGPHTAPAGQTDVAAQLAQLADMRSQGLLTDEEFTAAKGRLLEP